MAAPTNLTISYGSSSTSVVPIPAGSTYASYVNAIVLGGGFWFTDATGLLTFIPIGQVTKITAA